jgi:hypothetical protein
MEHISVRGRSMIIVNVASVWYVAGAQLLCGSYCFLYMYLLYLQLLYCLPDQLMCNKCIASRLRPLQLSGSLVSGPSPASFFGKLKFGHYHSICIAHAPTVVRWNQWFVFCGLLCTIVNMHNGIMAKLARPHPILGEALTRDKTTTWSGLSVLTIVVMIMIIM